MNKQKSYHHPIKNPNFFCNMQLFFSVQLGHLKLSGYGLLSTQGVQNRSQNCRSISQSEVILQYMRAPGAPAACRPKGVKKKKCKLYVEMVKYGYVKKAHQTSKMANQGT